MAVALSDRSPEKINVKVPIIWILGGPGSGKSTQCDKIKSKYGFTHLSSGDLLRKEAKSGSERGQSVAEIMISGGLVPTRIVLDLLKDAVKEALPTAKGFLIDGSPRKEQGAMFEETFGPVNLILFMNASEQTLVGRLLRRAETSGRADDNEATIKRRIETFNEHNDAIIRQYYPSKLKKIDAERDVEEIFNEIQIYLDPL